MRKPFSLPRLYPLFLAGVTLVLTGCKPSSPMSHTEGFAQGTTYHITYDTKSELEQAEIQQAITAELARIDKAISNYRPDSFIEQINATITNEPIETTSEIITLIQQAQKIHAYSQGCYDITIKPLFDLWGFKTNKFHLPSDQELQTALSSLGMNHIAILDSTHLQKRTPNLKIDLSSIGQGYTVNRLSQILEQHNAFNYMVEIGGELKVRGHKNDGSHWRIALEKPISKEQKVQKVVTFLDEAPNSLMPSGTYHHYFDENGTRYSHILDARNGKPIQHRTVMVNAFMTDSTLADAWSTALLCLGSEQGLKVANEQGIAALFIDQQGDQFTEITSEALKSQSSIGLENP